MTGNIHLGPTLLASFAASLVEFVEALTVILAVGSVRGWRWTLIGTVTAVAFLVALVAVCGRSLLRIPLHVVQLVVGALLVMFGSRWLRKAILRYAGVIPLHDEVAAFAKSTGALRAFAAPVATRWDPVAFTTAFKIVMLEGVEVVFIVIALGASGRLLLPAAAGAMAALVVVAGLGLALHRPLATIPENALKFAVGILLTAFGTFWVGEGAGLRWPGGDWSLLTLIAGYWLVAQGLTFAGRGTPDALAPRARNAATGRSPGVLLAMAEELWSLFVDDGSLALGVVAWIAVVWWSAGRTPLPLTAECMIFAVGIGALLGLSVRRAGRG